MATWPANAETDWNTKMLAYLAVEHETDGTHKATELTAVVTGEGIFGAWASKVDSTSYLAASDGFVCADGGTANNVYGYTDEDNPPTTLRVRSPAPGGAVGHSITMPVKKGDYWKVTGAVVNIYWLPIGI